MVRTLFNSHLDSNVSLGLNILEGCLLANRRQDRTRKSFGVDISEDNVDNLLSCAFQTAGALRDLGATRCYLEMALMYFWSLEDSSRLPEYWDSVRMLHLLPKYVGTHTKAGEWPIPAAFKSDKFRASLMEKYWDRFHTNYAQPLSYVPEIDKYWLGDSAVDVFRELDEPLTEVLQDATNGYGFVFPKYGNLKQWLVNKLRATPRDYVTASVLFLVLFFPYRCTELIPGMKPMTNVDWLLKDLGDEDLVCHHNKLTLLQLGPTCVRSWIGQIWRKRHAK